jgi:hypothetical protein
MTDQPSRGGRPGRSGPPGNSNAAKSHNYTVKREMKQLVTLALDRRTEESKQVEEVRGRLLASLGGADNLSAQEQLLVGEAAFLVLQLTAINTWLAKQPQLVDRRKRSLHPVVSQRLGLVSTLRAVLSDLGLKRRQKEVESLETYLRAKSTTNGHSTAPANSTGAAHAATPADAPDAADAPAPRDTATSPAPPAEPT